MCYFRYMFTFHLPYFPEVMFRMEDMWWFKYWWTGKFGPTKPGCYTEDDYEAYKYAMRNFGTFVIQH